MTEINFFKTIPQKYTCFMWQNKRCSQEREGKGEKKTKNKINRNIETKLDLKVKNKWIAVSCTLKAKSKPCQEEVGIFANGIVNTASSISVFRR